MNKPTDFDLYLASIANGFSFDEICLISQSCDWDIIHTYKFQPSVEVLDLYAIILAEFYVRDFSQIRMY